MVEGLTVEEIPAHRKRKSDPLYSTVCAFDIETTNMVAQEYAFCYSWAFQFGIDYTVVGRTIDDAVMFMRLLAMRLKHYLVIYVHNLSFEFQFLKGVYTFDSESVFATDRRKILKCKMFDHLELRCSYFLSNMSLARFCELENVEHKKLSGAEFDYSKIRYPWTPLSDYELQYQINDVLGLVEAVYSIMNKNGDNLYTIPLTNTGYVRRDARRALKNRRMDIIAQLPDVDLYNMLRRAFRGGNTHASRFRAGRIEKNVHNIDIASSYPAVQLTCQYPIKPFYKIKNPTLERFMELLKREKPILVKVSVWGLVVKDRVPVPYISRSKVWNIAGERTEDNGRILTMDYGELYFTDIDFRIFQKQYMFDDLRVDELAYSSYGYLPDELRLVTMEYFKSKTELKGVDDYYYMKSKNRLNSVYGMSAQDPCRDNIIFDNDENVLDYETVSIKEALAKYAKNPLMPYQWGCWVTAWARHRLQLLIDTVPYQNMCYCDTDSVKYVGDKIDFSSFNNDRKKEAEEHGYIAKDRKGKSYFLGVAEEEKDYSTFKTLGAKKYVYTDTDGDLHITIAGVNKVKGAQELAQAGGISKFKEGFTFVSGGGTESIYNDNVDTFIKVGSKKLHITDNICIKESTYTLGITDEYRLLLKSSLHSFWKKDLL